MKKPLVVVLVPVLIACLGLTVIGCGSTLPVTGRGRMIQFKSCDELVQAFKNGRREVLFDERAMPSGAATTSRNSQSSEAPQHSSTNVQVAGVDEGDIVKNDGRFIYTISGRDVVILEAYPAAEAKVVSRITTDENCSCSELFVQGDRLVVIGSNPYYNPEHREKSDVIPGSDITFVKIYNITDRAKPELLRTVEYEGTYSTSRMVNDNVYVVLATYPGYVLYEKKDIKCSDIIPGFRDTQEGRTPGRFEQASGCQAIEAVNPKSFESFLSILALSLNDESKSLSKRVIAGGSENVYASAQNIYVASTEYQYYARWDGSGTEKTTVNKFKLDGPTTKYLCSAEVPGTVLNQFSMDESGGYFRIATTRGHVSREQSSTTNNVYVLDPALKMTGKLEGLAPGERIYSARFMGNKAYLVTFKKVDPFFVLDMADPANPRVLGALKIPGYSDYLHPYDENHVIGVGKNTVEADPEEGSFAWYQGMKIAIFDVSDLANPKEMYKVEIGDRGTDSYALNDHKAFLFDRERNLLVLPIQLAELTPEQKAAPDTRADDYGRYTYQGAYVYDISLAGGIKLRGRITHQDDGAEIGRDDYYYGSEGSIKRSLYIGDSLYTISDGKVKINKLSDLAEEASIALTR